MNKQDFLTQLQKGLSGLPKNDIDERLSFYSEMIDDRIEDGLSEDEAVSEIGDVDTIVSHIIAETPLSRIVKEKIKSKHTVKAWEIILLVLGSPIWLPLLIAAFVVILSVYIVLWSVIFSLWMFWISLVFCTVGSIAASILFTCCGNGLTGLAMVGVGFFSAGLSVFMFFGCKAVTKSIILLTKKIASGIKNCFIKKEEA